jgi:hypothetical protein
MPQPLSNYRLDTVQLGYGNVLLQRPKLASMAMQVIEIWSNIDMRLNELVAYLLQIDISAAMAMLQAIDNASVRRDVVRAALKHTLSADDYTLFVSTINTTKSSEKRRHQFAHHIWGISLQFPDDVLLMDPKLVNKHVARSIEHLSATSLQVPTTATPSTVLMERDSIYVFTERDFTNDISDANNGFNRVVALNSIVHLRKVDPPKADPIRAALLAEPQIQREIARLSKQTNRSPL